MQDDFAELYRRHLAPIWRYLRARVPNDHDAEELTAEVFFRAFRDASRYDASRGSIGGWLAGIALHVVSDWWRRRGGEVLTERTPEPNPGSGDERDPAEVVMRRAEGE